MIMLERIEGSRKRGRPNMRWGDSIKEAGGMNVQELSRAVRTGRGGHHSLTGSSTLTQRSPPHAHRSLWLHATLCVGAARYTKVTDTQLQRNNEGRRGGNSCIISMSILHSPMRTEFMRHYVCYGTLLKSAKTRNEKLCQEYFLKMVTISLDARIKVNLKCYSCGPLFSESFAIK